jgi:hypothetical protein
MAYSDDFERSVLLDELQRRPRRSGNTGVFGNPAEVAASRQQSAPGLTPGASASASTGPKFNGDDQSVIRGILANYEYGPAGLAAAEGDLNKAGYTLEKASDGGYRGRVYRQGDNRQFDVIDPNESQRWWTDKRGTGWGFKDMGYANAGGGSAPRSAAPGLGGLSTSDAVQAMTQGDTYNTLVQRLQQILGPTSVDRQALLSLLQR